MSAVTLRFVSPKVTPCSGRFMCNTLKLVLSIVQSSPFFLEGFFARDVCLVLLLLLLLLLRLLLLLLIWLLLLLPVLLLLLLLSAHLLLSCFRAVFCLSFCFYIYFAVVAACVVIFCLFFMLVFSILLLLSDFINKRRPCALEHKTPKQYTTQKHC